eukprot:9504794-Lingulodinium_polyedra.AAC.1
MFAPGVRYSILSGCVGRTFGPYNNAVPLRCEWNAPLMLLLYMMLTGANNTQLNVTWARIGP